MVSLAAEYSSKSSRKESSRFAVFAKLVACLYKNTQTYRVCNFIKVSYSGLSIVNKQVLLLLQIAHMSLGVSVKSDFSKNNSSGRVNDN